MDKIFNNIISDKTSGSSELLQKLVYYFYRRISDGKAVKKEIETALNNLEHFAVIKYHLKKLELLMSKENKQSILSYLSSVIENEADIYQKIFTAIPLQIKNNKKIFTLSNSKTVYEVLKFWHQYNKNILITIAESQPECEGKLLFNKLKKIDVKTELVHDNAISKHIEKSDLLLLGCDIIMKNGDIINKTGSRDAAIIAKYFNKPVVVVSSKLKRISIRKPLIKGRNESEKFLFEKVENELISLIVAE
ncbi:MAG: hypothetical protein R6W68_09310 [Ignavibacteriaceae bacterium]